MYKLPVKYRTFLKVATLLDLLIFKMVDNGISTNCQSLEILICVLWCTSYFKFGNIEEVSWNHKRSDMNGKSSCQYGLAWNILRWKLNISIHHTMRVNHRWSARCGIISWLTVGRLKCEGDAKTNGPFVMRWALLWPLCVCVRSRLLLSASTQPLPITQGPSPLSAFRTLSPERGRMDASSSSS